MSKQDPGTAPSKGSPSSAWPTFPGADDWALANLCGGVERVRFYSREELAAAGVAPELLDDPRYVRAGPPWAMCSISMPTFSTSARARRS